MVVMFIGAALVAVLARTSMMLAPKIPVYEFAVLYPPLLWFGDTWGELKTTLYAQLSLHNPNVIQSDVYAATFDLYFPTWDGDFIHFAHVEDKYQAAASAEVTPAKPLNYTTPKEGFWKIKPRELFELKDQVELRIGLGNLFKILSHLIYQLFRGGGMLHIVSTGVTHITTPVKFTLTFLCDADLNVITNKMVGSDCVVDKLSPGRWENMTAVAENMQAYATTLQPTENGTVLVRGKPQRKSKV
jgi:hypothetical protein